MTSERKQRCAGNDHNYVQTRDDKFIVAKCSKCGSTIRMEISTGNVIRDGKV